jgi:hypothetical protein
MVALLAFHPIRLKNFAAFEIGRTFVKVKNKWWIVLPGAPASHYGLSLGISGTNVRSLAATSRSLDRKFGRLAPKAAVIFQYPKSRSGAVQRPVALPQRPVRIRNQTIECRPSAPTTSPAGERQLRPFSPLFEPRELM